MYCFVGVFAFYLSLVYNVYLLFPAFLYIYELEVS